MGSRVATAILISFGIAIMLPLSNSEAQSPVPGGSSNRPDVSSADRPTPPVELLRNIRRMLVSHDLLDQVFFTDEGLRSLFGPYYTLRPYPTVSGPKTMIFDDLGNVYRAPSGELTKLGNEPPCLRGGTLRRTDDESGAIRLTEIQVTAKVSESGISAGNTKCDSFTAALVEQEFGIPNSITDGGVLSPPEHGQARTNLRKTNPLGNSWLTYKFEDETSVSYLKFTTNAASRVAEFGVVVERKTNSVVL